MFCNNMNQMIMIYKSFSLKRLWSEDKGWSPDADMESSDSSEDWKLLLHFIYIATVHFKVKNKLLSCAISDSGIN